LANQNLLTTGRARLKILTCYHLIANIIDGSDHLNNATPTTEIDSAHAVEIVRRLVAALGEVPQKITAKNRNGDVVSITLKNLPAVNKHVERWKPKILAFIQEKRIGCRRFTIARHLNNNQTGGKFGQAIAQLVRSGELIEDEDGNLSTADMDNADDLEPGRNSTK
jgi:hypothetical protein